MAKDDRDAVLEQLAATNQALMERLTQLIPAPVKPMTQDELAAKMMSELRGGEDNGLNLVEVVTGCVSDVTGATFDAECHHKAARYQGRVVKVPGEPVVKRMIGYTLPAAATTRREEGGEVPMDMTEGAEPSVTYQQWVYENYTLVDSRRFVGKPLPAHVRAAALAVPVAAKTG